MSSDGGVILVKQVDDSLGFSRRFAACFRDERHPSFVEYRVEDLVRQRVMGLALGYEDLTRFSHRWRNFGPFSVFQDFLGV